MLPVGSSEFAGSGIIEGIANVVGGEYFTYLRNSCPGRVVGSRISKIMSRRRKTSTNMSLFSHDIPLYYRESPTTQPGKL